MEHFFGDRGETIEDASVNESETSPNHNSEVRSDEWKG